jgi:uncharacterized membrane protein
MKYHPLRNMFLTCTVFCAISALSVALTVGTAVGTVLLLLRLFGVI